MKKISLILTTVVLLSCLLLSGCGGYSLQGGQPDGEVVGNNGIAVKQGDYIYYINGSMPAYLNEALKNDPVASIFRMNADGTDRQQLSTRKAYAMYVVKENIYFVSPVSADKLCLFRVSINGGNERRIIEFSANGEYAFSDYGVAAEVDGGIAVYSFKTEKRTDIKDVGNVAQMYGADKLYYYIGNKAGVFSLAWEGGEPEQVTDRNGRIMAVTSQYLYYMRNEGDYPKLSRYDLEAKTHTTLSTSEYDTMLLSVADKLMVAYSSEKSTLYYMHLDGESKRVPILEERVDTYAIGKDRIFYCSNSEGALYSIDFDGNNKTKLAEIKALDGPGTTDPNYYLDVVGDKVFMFDALNKESVHMIDLVSGEVKDLANEE